MSHEVGSLIGIAMATAALASPASAQTIRGRLLDLDTAQPIDLGVVIMFTETGDSVTSTLTNPSGLFSLEASTPGSFVLVGSAFGYRETQAGVFELGEDAEMTVDFRLRPEPLPIDAMLVGVDRPVLDHHLVQNGFVRRFQRGLGKFITPYDIERSTARETESLLRDIPGVVVRPPGGVASYLGDVVKMWTPTMAQCDPILFVDGMRVHYAQPMVSISTVVPLATVEAVEVYRRPAEVPVEYGVTQNGSDIGSGAFGGTCGVLVFWTRHGLAPGQSPSEHRATDPFSGVVADPHLPPVTERGDPPAPGEHVRMELDAAVSTSLGLGTPWQGTFVGLREGELIVDDASSGRPVPVPAGAVRVLQVERQRATVSAVLRGVVAGSAFGVGSWLALRLLCGPACARRDDARFPAATLGAAVGLLVAGQGPGTHWVGATVPGGDGEASFQLPR